MASYVIEIQEAFQGAFFAIGFYVDGS